MFDTLIKNGTIIDGTRKPKYVGDIAIKDSLIVAIGDLHNETAHSVIDVRGMYVCPGFIDINNHSDTYWRIFDGPGLDSMVRQGVTTIIGGNCGSSLAPLANHDSIKSIQRWIDVSRISFNWLSMQDFLKEIEKKKLPINFGTLVGHATLRRGIMGDELRDMEEFELEKMKRMLAQAMKEGALGLSTGLAYSHAKLSSMHELVELAKVVKKKGGVYATHMRSEDEELLPAIEEAIEVSRQSGAKLQISHLKVMNEGNWHLMREALEKIESARMNGIVVDFDVYPYTTTGSVLYIALPEWVSRGGRSLMLARLKDPALRERIIQEMRESKYDYSKISVSISAMDKSLVRRRIVDIAQSQDKAVEEVILDLLLASDGRVITMMDVLSEENIRLGILNPFSMICSDGSGYDIEHKKSGEMVHPRNFGSFPRVLARYVRDREFVSWEEAIHKMTAYPADKFNLIGRGRLEKGAYADIVIFNPETVSDTATSGNPYQYPVGVQHVLVNGTVILWGEKYDASAGTGEVLRRKASLFEF